MRKLLLFLFVTFTFNSIYCQNIYDFQNLKSFYILKINPNIGSNTNGHTIHDAYNEIRTNSNCKKIFFVFPENDFQIEKIDDFFTQILNIPFDSTISKFCIVNQNIYDQYSKSNLTEIIYFYNNKIYFQEILKYTNINDFQNFPVDIINTGIFSNYTKTKIDSTYYHTKIDKYFSFNNQFFQLSDINNRFSNIDFENGKIIKTLNIDSLNPKTLYETYCSPSKKNLECAEKMQGWFKEHNRQSIMINDCFFIEYDSSLLFSISIQVYELLKNDIFVPGKNGELTVLKKNTPIAEAYTIFLKTDLDFNILNIFGISLPPKSIQKHIYPLHMESFYFSNDTLYVFNEPFNSSNYSKNKNNIDAISYYILKNNIFEFRGTLKPTIPKSINDYDAITLNHTFFKNNNNLYSILDAYPVICKVSGIEHNINLEVEIDQELLPSFVGDNKEIKMNFRLIDIKYYPKQKVYLILYEHNKLLKLDVYNSNFKRIQTTSLMIKEEWFRFRSLLHEETLILPSVEKDGICLIKIPIVFEM